MVQESQAKEPLCEAGHVVIASAYYPPQISGSGVLMRNLLSRFDPASYTVATSRSRQEGLEADRESEVQYLMTSIHFSYWLNYRWKDFQIARARTRLVDLIERKRARVLVAVYPDYYFLRAAREAAQITGVPWIAYFHDTLVEHQSRNYLAKRARTLQQQVFDEAARILVMSQGMAELFRSKYGVACTPVEHTYPEPIPRTLPEPNDLQRQGFWGGAVYSINQHAVQRVAEALHEIDAPLVIATNQNRAHLERAGVTSPNVAFTFYPERGPYLDALSRQGLLVLALDHPDESTTHEEELGTIFPTKTPEYLASGRPILVHSPEDYFLTRFFREHGCGLVVSERSKQALVEACAFALEDEEALRGMREAALEAAQLFSVDRVTELFRGIVNEAAVRHPASQTLRN